MYEIANIMNLLNTKYLNQLIKQSVNYFKKNYNTDYIHFKNFELINAYLISLAIEKEIDLFINILHKEEKIYFYLPTIVIASLNCFLKNLIKYKFEPQIGEVLQDPKGKKYYFVGFDYKNNRKFYHLHSNNVDRLENPEDIKKYIITTKEPTNHISREFRKYKEFFNSIFSIDNELPDKFIYRSIIVTDKRILDELKTYEIDGKNFYKAFPFRYITQSGNIKDNLPIDPMIYIVNKYETAQALILNQNESEIDTVFFVGASKYRGIVGDVLNDKNIGKFKSCIFIGSEDVGDYKSIIKWNWQNPEICYLNNNKLSTIDTIVIHNNFLTEKINKFDSIIKNIENEYTVILSELYYYVRGILRLIIPNSEESRLRNQLTNLRIQFEFGGEDILQEKLYFCNNYTELWEKITKSFYEIMDTIKENNPKYERLKTIEKEYDIDYILVPKDYVEVWKEEIKKLELIFTKVITLNKLYKIDNKVSCLLFYISNYEKFKILNESQHEIYFMLYNEEAKKLDEYKKRYKNKLLKEYKSEDRKKLVGIDYYDYYIYEDIKEDINELIERLYHEEEVSKDFRYEKVENIYYRISFDDGDEEIIDSHRVILLKKNDILEIQERVYNLIVGDKIRIYSNLHKDELYKIALSEDTQGIFKKIEEDSKFWKKLLLAYFYFKIENEKISLKDIYKEFLGNGVTVSFDTMMKWIDLDNKEKFPSTNKNLIAIKKTLNNQKFNQRFQSILKSKKAYRSIMIALGRDLSDDITNYIISKGTQKGNVLSKFTDEQINAIINENSPLRTIIKIEGIKHDDIQSDDTQRLF